LAVGSSTGPPTAAEEHGVGAAAGLERVVGQGHAGLVDGGAADEPLVER